MNTPGEPLGYDTSWNVSVSGRNDCHITVGYNQTQGHISSFLVRLHYVVSTHPLRWTPIARMDHNESPSSGHNIYKEGVHVDVSIGGYREVKLHPSHSPVPQSRGVVIRESISYFQDNAGTFVDIYEGRIPPGNPPSWPDGGRKQPHNLLGSNLLAEDMQPQPQNENTLTLEEATEQLAEAEGMDVEEFERQAERLEIGAVEEAEVREDSGK